MKTKLFIAFLLTVNFSLAQWSTSTVAESALYVCPGFMQQVITYDDGSSFICGLLSDYRYVQRLDPYGNKVWPKPVQVFYTPGTNSLGTGLIDASGHRSFKFSKIGGVWALSIINFYQIEKAACLSLGHHSKMIRTRVLDFIE